MQLFDIEKKRKKKGIANRFVDSFRCIGNSESWIDSNENLQIINCKSISRKLNRIANRESIRFTNEFAHLCYNSSFSIIFIWTNMIKPATKLTSTSQSSKYSTERKKRIKLISIITLISADIVNYSFIF